MKTKDAMKVIVDNTKADARKNYFLVKDWFAQVGRAMKTNPHRSKEEVVQTKIICLKGE